MGLVTRDECIPSWVGLRSVSSSRHETIELMKALMLLAGQDIRIIERIGVDNIESDIEFKERMSTTAKFLEEAAYRRFPDKSPYEDIQIYTGSNDAVVARLNARIATLIWRLYHRLLHMETVGNNNYTGE